MSDCYEAESCAEMVVTVIKTADRDMVNDSCIQRE